MDNITYSRENKEQVVQHEEFKEKLLFSSQSFLGLCKNCEKRTVCTYPKSPAGIWHCEEYE